MYDVYLAYAKIVPGEYVLSPPAHHHHHAGSAPREGKGRGTVRK